MNFVSLTGRPSLGVPHRASLTGRPSAVAGAQQSPTRHQAGVLVNKVGTSELRLLHTRLKTLLCTNFHYFSSREIAD